VTYEAYAVNGFRDGVVLDSPDGTRVPAGKRNVEDENGSPAFVGRVAARPLDGIELGLSGHHGAYNRFRADGVAIDERRDLTIGVVDLDARRGPLALTGEAAVVRVELPPSLGGLFASRQAGVFLELSRRFGEGWISPWPGSVLTAAVRAEAVDFDRDLAGDSHVAVTLGLNVRPIHDSVLKAAWTRGRARDRFNHAAEQADLRLSLATYF
jgi:hypothetical protein